MMKKYYPAMVLLTSLACLSACGKKNSPETDAGSVDPDVILGGGKVVQPGSSGGGGTTNGGVVLNPTQPPTTPSPVPSAPNVTPTALPAMLDVAQDLPSQSHLTGSDPENAPLIFRVVGPAAHGTVVLDDAAIGAYTFTPTAGYNGPDAFTFAVSDGVSESAPATVAVDVHVNTAPTAMAASLTIAQNAAAQAGTLSAIDAESNPLTFAITSAASHGSLILIDAQTGAFTYTPNSGFSGSDSFAFTANDGLLDSDPASVTITVTATPYAGGYSSRFTKASGSYATSAAVFNTMWTSFSLSVWVKMASTPVAQDSLYSIYDPTGPRYLRIYWSSATNLSAELVDGGTIPLTAAVVDPLAWNHIVYTWDPTCGKCTGDDQPLRLYINSTRVAQYNLSAGSLDFDLGAGHVEVGMFNNANFADAWIDDVAFWESELSTAEVATIYNGGTPTDYRTDFSTYLSAAYLQHFWWMGDSSSLPTIDNVAGSAPLTTSGVTFEPDAP